MGRQINLEGNPPTAISIYACYEHKVFDRSPYWMSSVESQDILVPQRVQCVRIPMKKLNYDRIERIAMVDGLPDEHLAEQRDPEAVAETLSDSELVEKCIQGFRSLREIAPVRNFARRIADRHARPGGRLSVSVSLKARN